MRQDSQGYLNSNQRVQKSKISFNKLQSQESKIAIQGSIRDDKDLFETSYDVALLILLRAISGLPKDDQKLEEADFNRELALQFVKVFQNHTRVHIHKSHQTCYQSYHAVYILLNLSSDSLREIFKEKGVLNFLLNMMPYVMKDPAEATHLRVENLNSLIIGQGFQGQQQTQIIANQQLGQGNQSTKMLNNVLLNNNYLMPLPNDGGNGNQSNTYASQRSPMNQQLMMSHPSKKEERKSREKTFMQKLTFNRAISEPPSANKNAVHPVTEDFNDQQNSSEDDLNRNLKGAISGMGTLEPVDEEDPKRMSKDGTTKRKSGFAQASQLDKAVPPLQISHIQQFQQQFINTPSQNLQSAGHPQHPTAVHSSSLVMTSYLNMPLGLFSTTMNHMPSHSKHMGVVGQNFKLNFVPQTTIAKSRLTRRQMSMSRKHTQKFSSVSNFAQGIYGEEIGSRDQKSIRLNADYNGSNERQAYGALVEKSSSQNRKGPSVPKLNINQITNDTQGQKLDTKGISNPAFNGQITSSNVLKSSNRSNAYSNQNFENNLVHAASRLSHQQMPQHPYLQSNTLMVKHQNTGQYLLPLAQPSGSYPNESDHNISVYDEMNASFIDDADIAGQAALDGANENAEEKLRQLAIQLGEACLTNDLAALISQKRDLELVKSARKQGSSVLGQGSRTTKAAQAKYAQRSISVSYTNHEPYFLRAESKTTEKQVIEDTNEDEQQAIPKINFIQRTQDIFLNVVYALLRSYQIEEIRFLKQPIQALNSVIYSKRIQRQIKQQQLLGLENGRAKESLCSFNEQNWEVSLMNGQTLNLFELNQTQLENDQKIRQGIYLDREDKFLNFIINQRISQTQVHQQLAIIFQVYQKFTFMNEEIIRAQIQNEISIQSNSERNFPTQLLPYQAKIHQTQQQQIFVGNNHIPLLNLNGATNANRGLNLQNSHDLENTILSYYQDAQLTMSNPSILWASCGIGFDVSTTNCNSSKSSASISFQKDRIRRKLDVMMHSIDKKLKLIIHKQYQAYISLEYIDIDFAKSLLKELRVLNCYLENNQSRIMLPQILEVILESLLMLKKALIDVSLKTSIFVIDFNKPGARDFTPETLILANQVSTYMPSRSATLTPGIKNGYNNIRSPMSVQRQLSVMGTQTVNNRGKLIQTQSAYRKLFAEYLKLISQIINMIPESSSASQTNEETMKLLNDVFISGDEQWTEAVKTFVISVFLSDICSSFNFDCIQIGKKPTTQMQQQINMLVDDIRGINLVNMDEQMFFAAILQTQNNLLPTDTIKLYEMAKKKLQQYLLCSNDAIYYFKSVMQFFVKAINSHFGYRHSFQKNKNVNSMGQPTNDDAGYINQGKGGAFGHRRPTVDQSQSVIIQGDEQNPKFQKYWKQIIRRMLYNIMYLITPPNGLLSSYLQNNAINFQNMGIGATTNRFSQTGRGLSSSISPSRFNSQEQDPNNRLRNNLCPLNFQLTQVSLSFLRLIFDLPDKFTKYAFIHEELMLFYIRTHYISFVRLYNKNFSKKQQWKNGSSQSAIESKKRSMDLCKQHLQCLFSISKNRSDETRRKLFQFKIVQFLCQEIELEFECTTAANRQKRSRLAEEVKKGSEISREEVKSYKTKQSELSENQNSVRIGPPIGVKSLNLSVASAKAQEVNSGRKLDDAQQQPNQYQQANMKIGLLSKGVPKLNISGLGLSEIRKDENGMKTQLEIDQLRQLAEEQKRKVESIQSSQRSRISSNRQQSKRDSLGKPKIPLVPKIQHVEKILSSDREVVANQQRKDASEAQIYQPVQLHQEIYQQTGFPGLDNQNETQQNIQYSQVSQSQNLQPQRRLPFVIPKLSMKGLTLSELVPGTQGPIIQQQQSISLQEEEKEETQTLRSQLGTQEAPPTQQYQGLTNQEQTLPIQMGNQIIPITQPKRPSLVIPPLKVAGLGLSEIQPGTQGPALNQPNLEEQKEENQVPQRPIQKPAMKFSIPLLKVAGLGLSEIQPGTQGPMLAQNLPSHPIEEEKKEIAETQENIQPRSQLGSRVPLLNINGLGLSEIIEPAIQQPSLISYSTSHQQDRVLNEPIVPALINQSQVQLQHDIQQYSSNSIPIGPPKRQMPFGIPKLNITGLGLSDIIPDIPVEQNQGSAIMIEEQKNQAPAIQPLPVKKGLPFAIPPLKVEGLGLTGVIPDPAEAIQEGPQALEEEKKQDGIEHMIIPPQKRPMPYGVSKKHSNQLFSIIPMINIAGLGLSELIQDKKDQIQILPPSINPPIEEEKKIDSPIIVKKRPLPFGMPKLKVEGLGFTDIIPDKPNDTVVHQDVNQKEEFVTINPSNIGMETMNHSIDFGILHDQNQQCQNDELFINRAKQGEREQFENTAPLKIRGGEDHERNGNDLAQIDMRHEMTIGASAPQDNRKSKKVLVATRNDPSDLSMKESIESAQFINLNNRQVQQFQVNKKLDEHTNLMIRASHVSNATALRVESIMEGGASISGSSMAPTPAPMQNQREERNMSTLNPTPNAMAICSSNYIQSPNNNASVRSKTSLGVVIEESKRLPLEQIDEREEQKPIIRLNMAKIRPIGSNDEIVVRQPSQSILKKPQIPSLVIPAKVDQPEGKDKIMMQIAYSQQLSNNLEAGDLTKLQDKLNKNNVKFQVLLDHRASGFSLGDETTPSHAFPKEESILEEEEEIENYADEEVYYKKERSMRPIYQDEELHALMISLVVCLLLNPERGTLDDLYCSQYPLDNGKQNILFLLHHHLNHPKNIEPTLMNQILDIVHKNVNPPLSGLRLLKLLCSSLFDIQLYNNGKEWKKLAEGAYAKVYESKTNIAYPQQVAIKQLTLPKSIYDRCVLHDIFTEITSLEELRLEQCVSDLYDYGVDQNSYYIVMKRYSCSLRQWRLEQQESPFDNLSLYLSIYKEFLKSLMIIHQHNITHYDIKCDNVFLDLNNGNSTSTLSSQFGNQLSDNGSEIKLTVGDFGECKIFSNEKDELCQRNRGTDFCKSPEMLQLVINTRKDTDKYDRRKQVGTNRLSDVWSAGCLLYELLTGEFLFYTPDYLQFHFRVTRPSEALFTQDKLDKIQNNVYLIDFMKFMLVRDPRLRPSIENVLKRFEHVHALLVSGFQNPSNFKQLTHTIGINETKDSVGSLAFDSALESCVKSIFQEGLRSARQQVFNQSACQPSIIQIIEDIAICNKSWAEINLQNVTYCNDFTHIIVQEGIISIELEKHLEGAFQLLKIGGKYAFKDGISISTSSIMAVPQLLDNLRKVTLFQGRALMIQSDAQEMSESLLIALSHIFQTNAYEAYTLIRSQNLNFRIGNDGDGNQRLQLLSQFISEKQKIASYLSSYPRFSCRCGSCLIILRRKYANNNYSNIENITCSCSHHYRNVDSSQCPSPGCNDFTNFMKLHFHAFSGFDQLQWGYLETDGPEDPFVLGPRDQGSLRPKQPKNTHAKSTAMHSIERMLSSNLSMTIDENSTLVSMLDKKATIPLLHGGARKSNMNTDANISRWKLYKCKSCHVWTHAVNEPENRFAILLNNRIKSQNHYVNIKQLNQRQLEKTNNNPSMSVRVPILNQLKLNLPF